jgi:hypothetical protein
MTVWLAVAASLAGAGEHATTQAEDYTIDREEVFEFARKPTVTRDGDDVAIFFETKGFCDVAVVIENRNGRIIRHVAHGVLGPNAPEPFQKDSKQQTRSKPNRAWKTSIVPLGSGTLVL